MEAKKILNRIFKDEQFLLKKLNGRRIIANAKDTFAYIDSDFAGLGLNKAGKVTPETSVEVHEMVGHGTFKDVFNSLPGKRRQKLLSQDQIIEICEAYPSLLQRNSATFFFFEKNWSWSIEWLKKLFVILGIITRQYFVVDVSVNSDGLVVYVDRLEDAYVWHGEYRHRVVSPQFKSSVT